MEYTELHLMKFTTDSGYKAQRQVMGLKKFAMSRFMMVSGLIIYFMAKEYLGSQTE
jgi:hypothetical protein